MYELGSTRPVFRVAGMDQAAQLLVFFLNGQRHALHLASVERVVRAVSITPLPKAPNVVAGVINVQGRLLPVIATRRRFGLAEREIALSDRLIIAHTPQRLVALLVDAVAGVISYPAGDIVSPHAIAEGLEYVHGIVKLSDGLLLISDLAAFLSIDEKRALDASLATI